jgi:hypothetical protein
MPAKKPTQPAAPSKAAPVIDAHLEIVPAEPAPLKPGHRRLASLSDLDALTAGPPDPWRRAREYVRGASMAAKMTVAFQVLTGFELIALKKDSGVQRGGDRRSNPKDSGLKWEDLVKSELGIGDDTARTWMKMAEAIRPRLKKLGGSFEALPMLELPPAQWNDEQRATLATVVKKATDGKTQLDFLTELGLAKKPQGSGVKGGAKPANPATPATVTTDDPKQAALDIWTPTIKQLAHEGLEEKSWVDLPDTGEISRATLKGIIVDLQRLLNDGAPVGLNKAAAVKAFKAIAAKKGAKAK